MTVAELIAALQKMPPDLPVAVSVFDDAYHDEAVRAVLMDPTEDYPSGFITLSNI